MANLDDFEIDPAADEELRRGETPEPPQGGGLSFPVLAAILAVVVVGTLGGLFYVFRGPSEQPTPVVEQPVVPAPDATLPSPSATAPVTLPPLDESDALVRKLAAALTSHPELSRWLSQSSLVRTVTAVVVNIRDGESPAPHLALLAPKSKLGSVSRAGRLVADGVSFEAYAGVADTLASLDGQRTAETFTTLEPLFELAYRDLGHPEGGFREALVLAMVILEKTPVPAENEPLERHGSLLRYADPRFEELSDARKQFLRMGPKNVSKVQESLGRLRRLIEANERKGSASTTALSDSDP